MTRDRRTTSPTYEVGYGKPPREHCFRKGQSGNPRGRPRKQQQPKISMINAQRAEDLLMEEAYRMVTLREGDQVIQLPVIQAIFRKMQLDALKGDRFAQRAVTDMVQAKEDRNAARRQEMFEAAILYKQHWSQEFERCDRLGIPRPEPLPHPDDVQIDPRTGSTRIVGPMDEREKEEWDSIYRFREDTLETIAGLRKKLKKDPGNKVIRDHINRELQLLERIDILLAERKRR